MKTIIAGSRGIDSQIPVLDAVRLAGWKITEVVSGTARGVDRQGEAWANMNNVPIKRMPADWNRQPDGSYDKAAGYRRNVDMADYADALIAIWDGVSPGTKHMIDIATKRRLVICCYNPETKDWWILNCPLNKELHESE